MSCSFALDEADKGLVAHHYAEYEQMLHELSVTHADIVELRTIGYSAGDESRPIYAMKITDNPSTEENEPELQLVGGIHGDEQISSYVMLSLANYLLDQYHNSDDRIVRLVDGYEIHIIPVANPHGFVHDSRCNADDVDINRNFSWAWIPGETHGAEAFDQPESTALMEDAYEHTYVLSIGGHSGDECISFPWDYIGTTLSLGYPSEYSVDTFTRSFLPAYPLLSGISEEYTRIIHENGNTNFRAIEGFDWYPAFGTMQDWMYGERGSLALTIEFHDAKGIRGVNSALYRDVWLEQREAMLQLMEIYENGLHGTVSDGQTGVPLDACIYVEPTGSKSAADPRETIHFCLTDSDVGDFHLLAQSGFYDITVTADGYRSAVIANIQLDSESATTIEVELFPGASEATLSRLQSPRVEVPSGYVERRSE